MNQIRLEWSRFPDSPLVSVEACGADAAQLRHYAQRVGFVIFMDDESCEVLIATRDKREELCALLESAGCEVENVEVLS